MAMALSLQTLVACGCEPMARSQSPARPAAEVPPVAPEVASPRAPVARESGRGPRLIAIAAGEFELGDDELDQEERPAHRVSVAAFSIDLTEVTVRDYKECVDLGGCKPPTSTVFWPDITEETAAFYSSACNKLTDGDKSDHPMQCVDWLEARTYCMWAGKRLPTEIEWEYAARGTDGRRYTWGSQEPSTLLANVCDSECLGWAKANGRSWKHMFTSSDGFPTTAPVQSFPGAVGPNGLYEMAGNVWEWTSSHFTESYEPDARVKETRVIRGGGWTDDKPGTLIAANRSGTRESIRMPYLGFRCAKSP